ncbi:MAG TPA: metalloprotease PmbA [Burkholderiaceae bacterium]|nr:metalloprotease PmbA [Burkholderiaceae bacterium]
MFEYDQARLREIADAVLGFAREFGASSAAVDVSENSGLSVNVRKGRIETIEQNRDKGLGVTVYCGQRLGHASSTDFSPAALRETANAAWQIARFTAEDPCAGLPDRDALATEQPDLKVFHHWPITVDEAVDIARRTERAAFDTSPAITNSEGASVSVSHGHFVAANSLGFVGGYRYSRHSIACSPIAGRRGEMQRDDWYSSHCDPARLADPEALGRYAAERALARLGARRLGTRRVPVLFEAPLACGLLGHFVQAASGGALYRRASFLVDSLGQRLFPEHVDIVEDPHRVGESGSTPFDNEGVATHRRHVVEAGELKGYFLSTYSARKLGMKTTGNAGGSHNLSLASRATRRGDSFEAMLRRLGTGLLVTDLMGQGVNYVTGDYSRGASGFWVEGGKIAHPVEEITIAGNLRDMFRGIAAVGADEITRGTKRTGSVLIDEMAVAGS